MNSTLVKFLIVSLGIKLLKKASGNEQDNKILKMPNFTGVLEVKHALSGRIRFYAPVLKGNTDLGELLANQVKKINFVKEISINTVTGSILIIYKEEEVEPVLLMGIIIKLLNLDGEINKEPVSLLKKEITNVKDCLNLAIYDKTKGIIDGKTLIIIVLLFLGVYAMKNRPYANIPGLNYLWWAYTSINK